MQESAICTETRNHYFFSRRSKFDLRKHTANVYNFWMSPSRSDQSLIRFCRITNTLGYYWLWFNHKSQQRIIFFVTVVSNNSSMDTEATKEHEDHKST